MRNSKKLYWYITGFVTVIILVIGFGITPIVSKIHKSNLFKPSNVNININTKNDVFVNDELLYPWNDYEEKSQMSIVDIGNDILRYWYNMKTYSLLSSIANNHGVDVKKFDQMGYSEELHFSFINEFLLETIPKLTLVDNEYNKYNYYTNYFFRGEYNNEKISYVIKNYSVTYFSIDTQEDEEKLSEQVVLLKSMINDNKDIVTDYVKNIIESYNTFYVEMPTNMDIYDFINTTPDYMIINDRINVIYHIHDKYILLFYSFTKGNFVGYNIIEE